MIKWGVITKTADTAEAYKSQQFLEIKPLAKKLSLAVPSGFHVHIIQSHLAENNTVNSFQLSDMLHVCHFGQRACAYWQEHENRLSLVL